MKVHNLDDAIRFVNEAGFAYVFPDGKVPLPSLWGAVCGDPTQEMDGEDHGWTKEVELTWKLKDQLGESKKVWFGRFFRGKGSLISARMLTPLYRLIGQENAEGLSPKAREIYDRLCHVGRLSTFHLRMSLRMSGKKANAEFDKLSVELYRKLLIANVGLDDTETRWPAAVLGPFSRTFPKVAGAAAKLTQIRAVDDLMKHAPALPPRKLASLFGIPAELLKE